MKNDHSPAFVGIKDFCRISGLSQFMIRNRLREGTLPHIRAGQNYLVNVEAALEVLNEESKMDERAGGIG